MEALYDLVVSLSVELSFLVCFAAGFVFLRLDLLAPVPNKTKSKSADSFRTPAIRTALQKAIDGRTPTVVLSVWRQSRFHGPVAPDHLRHIVHAFLDAEPDNLVHEIIEHMLAHHSLRNEQAACAVLDVAARGGNVQIMEKLATTFRTRLRLRPSMQIYEVLLGGYAASGDEEKVALVKQEVAAAGLWLSARALSLTIKGFLKHGLAEAVVVLLQDMARLGLEVPSFAVTQLMRVAVEKGTGEAIFDSVIDAVRLNSDAVAALLEGCFKRQASKFARRVEAAARLQGCAFTLSSYDCLLKLFMGADDDRVLLLWEEIQQTNIRITEGFCVGLLSRCAETKFLRFAEAVVAHVRARGNMTIAVYSALMKVYAFSNMYDRACDLYADIQRDGLEPDATMCACLMKFAVQCGRPELSRQISEIAPAMDIQNYTSLIRACGRDKDVDRAFAVLRRLEAAGMAVDLIAYNCVLDVCVSAGDLQRARQLMLEMRKLGSPDLVAYNTLLKGYCQSRDLRAAKEVLVEMAREGLKPNFVSFNCMLNSAVASGSGKFEEAWGIVDMMDRHNIKADHYTISILLKMVKRSKNPKDASRVLAYLDREGVDVCSDEIVLNSILETCIRHQEFRRLDQVLAGFAKSAMLPSVPTYGTLIKAAGVLKRLSQCWELWRRIDQLGLAPNDIVLGCMLNALVSNQELDQAVRLLAEWKARVPPNMVMYSTILKGFAAAHQGRKALLLLHEMRAEGLKPNAIVYNAVIDAFARSGDMDSVGELVVAMEADRVVPDAITHSTIVKGYCIKGDLDRALAVFRDMQKSGMVKDSIVYNTLLDGCIRHASYGLADSLLEEMQGASIPPSNFTLGIVVKMYGRRRQLDKAFTALEEASQLPGFTPTNQVLACLMCSCLNNDAFDKAFRLYDDLQRSPQGADTRAVSAMVSGCIRLGELAKACEVLEQAYGRKAERHFVDLGPEPLSRLVQALQHRGLAEELALPLLDRLSSAGVAEATRLHSAAIGGVIAARVHSRSANGGMGGPNKIQADRRQREWRQ